MFACSFHLGSAFTSIELVFVFISISVKLVLDSQFWIRVKLVLDSQLWIRVKLVLDSRESRTTSSGFKRTQNQGF